ANMIFSKSSPKTPIARSIGIGCSRSPRIARWRRSTARSICGSRGCGARSRSIQAGPRPFAPCGASATCSCRRRIERSATSTRRQFSAGGRSNLGQRAAQLARQRSKSSAAGAVVAGFARALEQCGRTGDARGAHRLGGALELVRRGCERRKVARAGAGFDRALALDRGVAKLPEKRIDGGLVAEPVGQNGAVDRSDGARLRLAVFVVAVAAVGG